MTLRKSPAIAGLTTKLVQPALRQRSRISAVPLALIAL